MNSNDYEIVKKLKIKLAAITTLIDIKIFGSRARGDNDIYSDLDVFVEITYINDEIKEQISNAVWETGYEHHVVISPLIFTKDEIENSALSISPIVVNIREHGISI